MRLLVQQLADDGFVSKDSVEIMLQTYMHNGTTVEELQQAASGVRSVAQLEAEREALVPRPSLITWRNDLY